jgi:hypothetical protein
MELRDNYESWTREELRAALALSEQKRQEAEEEVTRLHDVVLEANEYAKRLYDNRRQVEEERDALLGQLSVCKEALEYYANRGREKALARLQLSPWMHLQMSVHCLSGRPRPQGGLDGRHGRLLAGRKGLAA